MNMTMAMTSVAFDRHEFIKDLVASGFKEEQAEVISAGILRAHEMANLATKTDVQMAQAQTNAKIDKVASNLDAKIDRVAGALDAKIDRVAAELDAKIDKEIAEVKNEITAMKGILNLHGWMLGIIIAGVMAIFIRSFFGS